MNSLVSKQTNLSTPPESIRLIDWLQDCKQGNQYAEQVRRYRETGIGSIKKGLPLITVGALLTGEKDHEKNPKPGTGYRVPEQIVTRTGWIALDIDTGHNPHLNDAEHLRDILARNVYVAFSGISTGGKGVWALVRVANPDRQADYFRQLQTDFKSRGIILDKSKGKNPHDARFYSYDPGAIIKDDYRIYDRLPVEKPKPKRRRSRGFRARTSRESLFKGAETFARNRGYTFTHGVDMHLSITHLCIYLNLKGIPREEAEAYVDRHILPLSEIKSNCISGPYTQYASDHGALRDNDQHHACQGDRPAEAKYEDPAPYGFNPWTGEIFDERGYPADWDEVTLKSDVIPIGLQEDVVTV